MRRGQSLILTVMIMLVVTVTVFFTFSVGERVRKKTALQAMADASAYSLSVAEARAFNFYALSNRAIVSHMVSTLSVAAHDSWLTWYEDVLAGTVQGWLDVQADLDARIAAASSGNSALRPCVPCIARMRNASQRARWLAEWFAYAMPTDSGRVVDSQRFPGGMIPGPRGPRCAPGVRHPAFTNWNTCVEVIGNRAPRGTRRDADCYYFNANGACLNGSDRLRVSGARGAQFFHDQFHTKSDDNWCRLLLRGIWDHANKMQLLRGQQLTVERDLMTLMMGDKAQTFVNAHPRYSQHGFNIDALRHDLETASGFDDEDVGRDDRSHTPDLYADAPKFERQNQPGTVTLAEELLKRTGIAAKPTVASREFSARSYDRSVLEQYNPNSNVEDSPYSDDSDGEQDYVDNHTKTFFHRDFDELTYASRFPEWIYARANHRPLDDRNWQALVAGAQRIASAGPNLRITVDAIGDGVTKTSNADTWGATHLALSEENRPVWVYDGYSTDPGLDPYHLKNGPMWFSSPGGLDPALWNSWLAGNWERQSNSNHPGEKIDRYAYSTRHGTSFGIVSVDHGYARVSLDFGCANVCNPAPAQKFQWHGRDTVFNKGTSIRENGVHGLHGTAGTYDGHQQGALNSSNDRTYPGHMRFSPDKAPNDLWRMPEMLVVLEEPIRNKSDLRPWDFDFKTSIFGDYRYQSIESPGDQAAGNTMAAASKAMTYYHRPNDWREVPNLWNPYWRAKLHPMESDELRDHGGHPATRDALNAINTPNAVNQ